MSILVFSTLGQILLLAVLLTLLVCKFVQNTLKRKFVVAGLLVLGMLIPIYGLTVAQWLRSVVGDLSVLMLVLMLNILAKRHFDFNLLNPASRLYLLWGVVAVGAMFYPFALGLGPIDPYHFGYAPAGMGVSLVLVSIVCWFTDKRDLAVVLILPLLAFNLQILESGNLWDYLLDPVLFVYALVQSVIFWWKSRSTKRT